MADDRTVPPVDAMGRFKALRPVEVVRALWGLSLLTRPRDVLVSVHHAPVDPVTVVVARVLGARHLAQAAVTVCRPSPELVAAGVFSDAAHAASMLGLAAVSRVHRRAGLTDAAIAAVFAAVGVMSLRSPVPANRTSGRGSVLVRRLLTRAPGGAALLNRVVPPDPIGLSRR